MDEIFRKLRGRHVFHAKTTIRDLPYGERPGSRIRRFS